MDDLGESLSTTRSMCLSVALLADCRSVRQAQGRLFAYDKGDGAALMVVMCQVSVVRTRAGMLSEARSWPQWTQKRSVGRALR